MKQIAVFSFFLLLLFSCQNDPTAKWKSYPLAEGWEAAFPAQPKSKQIAFDANLSVWEFNLKEGELTYSVNILLNKALSESDNDGWQKFLKEEVLAFKAQEQKNIKIWGTEGVYSKVRTNELCGISVNAIINNRMIINASVTQLKSYPGTAMVDAFFGKIKVQ